MHFELIALDLDGTSLQKDHSSFSPRLITALMEAHKLGVSVLPVTGRQYNLLPPAVTGGGAWKNLAVLCNGAEIRRLTDGELLDAHYLSKEHLIPLIEAARHLDLPIELSSNGILYLTRSDWEKERLLGCTSFHTETILGRYGRTVDDLSDLCRSSHDKFEKVNFLCIPYALRENIEKILSDLPVSAVWASPSGMEITHRDATKAIGLLKACSLLGIDPERTLALGDSGNDVSMLRAAGLGIAMGNAPDWVRAAADAVTDAFDADGAAIAIERYILGA